MRKTRLIIYYPSIASFEFNFYTKSGRKLENQYRECFLNTNDPDLIPTKRDLQIASRIAKRIRDEIRFLAGESVEIINFPNDKEIGSVKILDAEEIVPS